MQESTTKAAFEEPVEEKHQPFDLRSVEFRPFRKISMGIQFRAI